MEEKRMWGVVAEHIRRGKRLTRYMKTHYRHNDFIMTLNISRNIEEKEALKYVARSKELGIARFKARCGNGEGYKETIQFFRTELTGSGRTWIRESEDDEKIGGRLEIIVG